MGAGASTCLQAAIKESSPEQLAAALGSLPADSKSKLIAALETAQGSQVRMPDSVTHALEEQFELFDIDKNGLIELEESLLCFRELAEARGIEYNQEHAEESFQKMDIRGAGALTKDDFLEHYRSLFQNKWESGSAEMMERKITSMNKILQRRTDVPCPVAALLREMFDLFDSDHDNFLTMEEDSKLLLTMGIELNAQDLKEYQLCPKDGKVSVVEFMEYFHDAQLMDWMDEHGQEWTVNHLKEVLAKLKKERAASKK